MTRLRSVETGRGRERERRIWDEGGWCSGQREGFGTRGNSRNIIGLRVRNGVSESEGAFCQLVAVCELGSISLTFDILAQFSSVARTPGDLFVAQGLTVSGKMTYDGFILHIGGIVAAVSASEWKGKTRYRDPDFRERSFALLPQLRRASLTF